METTNDPRAYELLYQISCRLNNSPTPQALLNGIIQSTAEMNMVRANLFYIDLDKHDQPEWLELVAVWQQEGPSPIPVGTRFYLPEYKAFYRYLAQPDAPYLIENIETDEAVDETFKTLTKRTGAKAVVSIPLLQNSLWVGVISFVWLEPHQFSALEQTLYHGLMGLVAPAAHSRRLIDHLGEIVKEHTYKLQENQKRFEAFYNATIEAVIFMEKGIIIDANQQATNLFRYDSITELIGTPATQLVHPEDVDLVRHNISSGYSLPYDCRVLCKDGTVIICEISGRSFTFEDDTNVLRVTSLRDITTQRQLETEREQLQQEIISAHKRSLQELSTPIIPLMEGIIILPLIGSIDSMRANDIMRSLLKGISQHKAKIAILDITGVALVDTGVAGYLDKTIQAARLKGTKTIITGISDAIAETIIDLGIDWSNIETLRDLQTGLLVALKSLDIKLQSS